MPRTALFLLAMAGVLPALAGAAAAPLALVVGQPGGACLLAPHATPALSLVRLNEAQAPLPAHPTGHGCKGADGKPGTMLKSAPLDPGEVALAVMPPAHAIWANNQVSLRLPAHSGLTVKSCASADGIHVTAWNGTARVWHGYAYLGQDLDPTCTPAETAEDANGQ